jgi:hypothetical protein
MAKEKILALKCVPILPQTTCSNSKSPFQLIYNSVVCIFASIANSKYSYNDKYFDFLLKKRYKERDWELGLEIGMKFKNLMRLNANLMTAICKNTFLWGLFKSIRVRCRFSRGKWRLSDKAIDTVDASWFKGHAIYIRSRSLGSYRGDLFSHMVSI